MTRITVLGPVSVVDEGASLSPRDRVVICVLVTRRGREVSADTLSEALWGEKLPASAHKVVQGCIARLRRRLGREAIVTGRSGYRLAVPAEDVDAGRFERLVNRTRELLALDHADQAAYAAEEALTLWRGRPLVDLDDWEPGRGEADRLTELRLEAEELRVSALLSAGRHAEALPEARLRMQEEPLREHRWALLARAQYQDGRQAESLATLRRARETLADELGLDPGTELVELESAVLQQDPTLERPTAGEWAAACPWPGLASYDVDDSETFFGRATELVECLDRLSRTGVLAVVGPSGSGKSSLVRAGLAAHLQREGRRAQVITPDPRPLDVLAAATAGATAGSVLVVDQCEEIFAPAVPPKVRASFLRGIVEQARDERFWVVLTLRADRLGELAAYPAVARLVEDGLYLLKGIGPDGVREVIEQPARRTGLLLEEGLVDLLVRDVEGEPGSLPLLAHALRQTWERRQGTTLTVEGYRASGGIRGAVARSAEQVYEDATAEQRHALRELLLRMVEPGPGGEPVGTSVARDLVADGEHAAVVEQLIRARLVTAQADRLELAHVALARAWPRLQSWLADDVQGERIRHHLSAGAGAWELMGRPESELYRGARLAAAREWRDAGTHRLSGVEQEFLTASEEAHQSQLSRAEDEARRQRRLNHRLRVLIAGAVLLALVAVTFGTVTQRQWRDAEAAAAAARSHELAASALANLPTDPALAKALAVAAWEGAPPGLEVSTALHNSYAADPVVGRVSLNHRTSWTRLWTALHPDGTRVAMTGESALEPALALEVHDPLTGELQWEWTRPEEPGYESAFVAGAAYSTDGSVLASGVVWDPTSEVRLAPPADTSPAPADRLLGIHLWDATSHEALGLLDVGPCGGWPLVIAEDVVLVRSLVPSTDPASAADTTDPVLDRCDWKRGGWANLLVDRKTGEQTLLGVTDPSILQWNVGAALSGDGSVAAVWDQRSSASTLGDRNDYASTVLFDTKTGTELGRVRDTSPVDLDATGERVLLRDRGPTESNLRSAGTWRVMDVDALRTVTTFDGHEGRPTYGAFSSDGRTVFTSGLDNVLIEWDAATGEVVRRVVGAGSGGPAVADDRWVVVPRSLTAGAVLVDTFPRSEGWSVPACGGFGFPDQLRVAGDRVVVGRGCEGNRGALEILHPGGGGRVTLPDAAWNESLAVSSDGTRVVAQGGRRPEDGQQPALGALRVHDLGTGKQVLTLEGFCEHTLGVPVESGCGTLPDAPFGAQMLVLRWSPDDRWIAGIDLYSGSYSGVEVWDASTGDLAWTTTLGEAFTGASDVIFSPDSSRLIVSTAVADLVTLEVTSGEEIDTGALPAGKNYLAPGLIGYSAGGALAVVTPLRNNTTGTSLLLLDPDTLGTMRTFSNVVDGDVRSAAVSPDGTRIAMAASEGFIGVWELATGVLLDRADPALDFIEGVQWLDDQHLLVMSGTGALVTVMTDPGRLSTLVRGSLTRGLTLSECAANAIHPCPDLGTLRRAGPTVPEDLRGSYTLSWSVQDLWAAGLRHYEDAYGAVLDEASQETLKGFAEERAGNYRFTFSDSGYVIMDNHGDEWCTGAVTLSPGRPDRLLLGADRGTGCFDFHYAQIGWEIDGDNLFLPRERFAGAQLDAVLWTSKPLERIG